jgi:hypothetical protein
MIRIGNDAQFNRTVDTFVWLAGVPVLAWFIGNWLLERDLTGVITDAMMLAGAVLAVVILSRWRLGIYLFLIWIVFEDFGRKYLGNSVYAFFGKDILIAIVYAAFFLRRGPRAEKLFRPQFWLPLVAFLLWAAMEAFNFQTPSPLYGLLGLKLYFYYVPLMFIGYALVRTEVELRRFLIFNLFIAGVVALLGILQALFGQQLLNPAELDENLRDLGDLTRASPLTHLTFNRLTSVFVSDGRFSSYLILMFILGLGAIGYFIQRKWGWGIIAYLSFGLTVTATILAGVRTALVFAGVSTILMLPAMYWGQRLRKYQLRKILRTVRNVLLLGAVGTAVLIAFFPDTFASRWAFYAETLSLQGPASELHTRLWDYPLTELGKAISRPDVIMGRGLGTASLGYQYVTRFLHAPPPGFLVENGYGQILLEVGIPGFMLWQILAISVVLSCWSVVKRLRNTPLYSLGFGILWYVFLVMFPLTYVGLSTYQNYLVTAFLWLLIGVLFRLPSLVPRPATPVVAAQPLHLRALANDPTIFSTFKPLGQPPPKSG